MEKKNFFPEQQWAFRKNRGVHQGIFSLRRLGEQAKKFGMDIFYCFVDIVKAYDTVNRAALIRVLRNLGIPDKMVSLIDDWHTNNFSKVKMNGQLSNSFANNVGVRQEDVLAPLLFNIWFTVIINETERKLKETVPAFGTTGFGVPYGFAERFADNSSNSSWAGFEESIFTKSTGSSFAWFNQAGFVTKWLWSLLYADDAALCDVNVSNLQTMLTVFTETAADFGMVVSKAKTEVMHQTNLGSVEDRASNKLLFRDPLYSTLLDVIKIGDFAVVETFVFKYLGSQFERGGDMETEIARRRIQLAWVNFNMFRLDVFTNEQMDLHIRCRLYKTVVQTTLLWDCNNWGVLNQSQLSKISSANHAMLLRILGRSYFDHLTHEQVAYQTKHQHKLFNEFTSEYLDEKDFY